MIEDVVLSNLAYSEAFARKVLPFLKAEYFSDKVHEKVFQVVSGYINQYNSMPTPEALGIDLSEVSGINDDELEKAKALVASLKADPNTSQEWLLKETENFCQKRAIHLALMKSIEIYEGKNSKLEQGAIPAILQDALAVSFDTKIGHDFFESAEKRYDWYHLEEHKVPFGVEILNRITAGGVSKKTLTILYGGVNVGKTAIMCALAADNIRDGLNVLYISMEMSEEMISHRIDANLLDTPMNDVAVMPKEQFLDRLGRMKEQYAGNLVVKEYPTSMASVTNFRYLLNELKLKKGFIPDIIYVDYLNICSSSRISKGKSGLYEYVGSIGEELRGLAVEQNLPVITATQFNRDGFKSTSPGLDDVAESFGTGMIADLILSVIRTEELDKDNLIKLTQLKTRYMNKGELPVFTIGMDINKMKLFNIEDVDQKLSSEKVVDDMVKEADGFIGLF